MLHDVILNVLEAVKVVKYIIYKIHISKAKTKNYLFSYRRCDVNLMRVREMRAHIQFQNKLFFRDYMVYLYISS